MRLLGAAERIGHVSAIATVVKIAVDVFIALDDRRKKRAAIDQRVADLESEIAALKAGK
jgi:hypothetical protein